MTPRRSLSAAAPYLATAGVALAYRLLVWSQVQANPVLLEPVLDGAAHSEWADALRAGEWPPGEPFFRAPGYVYYWAALRATFGMPGALLAQLLLGAVTPLLTAALAGRLFGREAAWIAGLGAALYPTLVFFDLQPLAPALAIPLALAGAVLAIGPESGPASRRAVAALLFGCATIVRPPVLLAGLLVPAFRIRADRREAAWLLLVLLAPSLLVTARNAAVGDPAFVATQGGLNFYLGNGAQADGYAATFPDDPTAFGYRMMEAAKAIAEEREGRALRESEVSAHWRSAALADIAADPARWLGLLAKKAALFAYEREIPNNQDFALGRTLVPALRGPAWGLWFPLAALTLGLGVRRSGVPFVAALVAAVALGAVLFFVNARFRLPAVPFVVALGAGAIPLLREALRASAVRRVAMGAALAGVTTVLAWGNWFGLPREPWVTSYLLLAEAEAKASPVRALGWVERALVIEPDLYPARLAEIDLRRRLGQYETAEAVVDRGLAARPDDPVLLGEKAILRDLRGDPAGAVAVADRVLALDPANWNVRINRAVMLARADRRAEAEAELAAVAARTGTPEGERAAATLAGLDRIAPR